VAVPVADAARLASSAVSSQVSLPLMHGYPVVWRK